MSNIPSNAIYEDADGAGFILQSLAPSVGIGDFVYKHRRISLAEMQSRGREIIVADLSSYPLRTTTASPPSEANAADALWSGRQKMVIVAFANELPGLEVAAWHIDDSKGHRCNCGDVVRVPAPSNNEDFYSVLKDAFHHCLNFRWYPDYLKYFPSVDIYQNPVSDNFFLIGWADARLSCPSHGIVPWGRPKVLTRDEISTIGPDVLMNELLEYPSRDVLANPESSPDATLEFLGDLSKLKRITVKLDEAESVVLLEIYDYDMLDRVHWFNGNQVSIGLKSFKAEFPAALDASLRQRARKVASNH